MDFWIVNKEETEDIRLELEDPDGWYKATVKMDGCIDFTRVYNKPLPVTGDHPQSVDYIHYCDLDEEIDRLCAVRDEARKFFGEWPEC